MAKDKVVERTRELAKAIEQKASGRGFALFIELRDKTTIYASNAERADVFKTLDEWLEKTLNLDVSKSSHFVDTSSDPSHFVDTSSDPHDDPFQSYDRINLERLCAEIGVEIGKESKLCLFLFDFGGGGNLAYWINTSYARHSIKEWLSEKKWMKKK